MSVQEHNPFKVGDKVKLLKRSYEFNPIFWRKYDGFKYSFVKGVIGDTISTSEDSSPQHYSHFEFYEEEKDMTLQTTPQTQPKTKRVPFTHDLWEKWKDNGGEVTTMNGRVLDQFTCFNLRDVRVYAGVYTEVAPLVGTYYSHHLFLEIPITTKRIPFNPELKDAKVFYGGVELIEWVQMKSGVVCGSYDSDGFAGVITNLYHPNDLQMEIEENV